MADIELFNSAWEFMVTVLILFFGLIIAFNIRNYFNCSIIRLTVIYCWHTMFSILYVFYVLKFGGDALEYFSKADISQGKLYTSSRIFGTPAVVYIALPFVSLFKVPFIGVCFVFHIFGFIGLLAFDASLRAVILNRSKSVRQLSSLIVFLPSVSFWSSALGKDAIAFMAVGLALWAALNISKRVVLMIIAITFMLIVRPHMAGLMVIALAGSFVLQKNISLTQRLILGFISLIVVAVLVPFALNYAGVGENVSAAQLNEYIEQRQGYNLEGGGSIDISSMSLPEQLFTYMFRPLPFEAHSVASFMASLDNIILLYLFFVGLYNLIKKRLTPEIKSHNLMFMWFYLCGSWIILSVTTANLGIAVRQKWMIAPMLIFLIVSVIGREERAYNEN